MLAAAAAGDRVQVLAATDTFMTTALVRRTARTCAVAHRAWQLTPHGRFAKEVHSTLRAAVARHTKPQPFSRTAILVCALAQCVAAAPAHALDRPRQKQRLRRRRHKTLGRSQRSLEDALFLLQLLQLLCQLAAGVHAHEDVGAANKFTGDEHLRNGGPVAAPVPP